MITMTMNYANFVGLFSATSNQNTNESMTIRKKRRKRRWWRQKAELSLTIVSAFTLFLMSTFSAASASYSEHKNWKTNVNGFAGGKDLQNHYKDSIIEKRNRRLGGTKWATASEEANDELHDAEILRAVQHSIAEWEERRRVRDANSNSSRLWASSLRAKRSPAEKVEASIDEEENKEPPNRVCYEELGCFEEAGYIDLLPNSPEEVNTRYLLYNSRRSRGDTPLLDVSAQNVSSLWEWVGKAFNVSAPTKVIVHGFGSSCSNVWVYEMRSALMSVEDCNIICVDWENGATIPNYVRAAANTRLVGKQVAILLSSLEKYVNLSLRNVHMIGFSLGAHVAGFAGSELKNLSRITGLDPAGPLFESQDRRARLDSMDAQFVDVIHSNGENLILGGLGAWQPMGHVDFYPNGGRMQKGCTNLFVGAVSDMIWSANEVYGRSLCNHRRAYKFFTDSVSPKCQFPAVPCESYDHFVEGKCFPCDNLKDCSNMGYYADKFPGRGALFLLTRDEEPFCANQYMARVENSPFKESLDKKSSTFGKIQINLIGDLELNETFTITQKKDDKLIRGESVSRIIVPHPALQNFLKIQITYFAYKGWLSSGEPNWRINKISLTNSYGQILSACKEDLELESGIPVMLQLVAKDCGSNDDISVKPNGTVSKPTTSYDINRVHSHEFHANQTFDNLFPHTQVVRLGNEILNTNELNLSASEWSNSSKTNKAHPSNRISLLNTSKIGVGVTEYLNDPWKQKADFLGPVSHGNHIDNVNYDSGEGRRLAFDTHASRRHANKSTVPNFNSTSDQTTGQPAIVTAVPVVTTIAAAAAATLSSAVKSDKVDKQTLYEFVTELQPAQSVHAETEITEPILKPKVILASTSHSSVRSRKSHSVLTPQRPSYGKSINVSASTTAATSSRRSLNTSAAASVYGSTSVKSATASSAEESNEFLDLLQAQPEHNSRALKKSGNLEPETTSSVKNTTSQLFVVQFLPQKLVSFLEQAERYARMAFQPFISSQETKNGVGGAGERSRRVRTFNTNRWTSQSPKETTHDRYDMETQASEAVAQIVPAPPPSARVISSSFPYAYDMPRQHFWQQISRYPATARKYIPLHSDVVVVQPTIQEVVQPKVQLVFPVDTADSENLQ